MERFQHTANLLTVVQTCRRHGRSVIDFFQQSVGKETGLTAYIERLNNTQASKNFSVGQSDLIFF